MSTLTRTDVGAVDDFPDDGITALQVEGRDVVLIRQGDEFFALPDRCTHARYPLNDAELLEGKIKCAHHGATFDLHTGKPTLPAVKKIRLYDVEIQDGRVMVSMQEA
ncbi:MAG: Rieske 2Fe-2S domain-containing protein [Deinococcales bacterium]